MCSFLCLFLRHLFAYVTFTYTEKTITENKFLVTLFWRYFLSSLFKIKEQKVKELAISIFYNRMTFGCLWKQFYWQVSWWLYNTILYMSHQKTEYLKKILFYFFFYNRKLLRHDRRAEPCVGERVPYVIVYGSPGLPLIQLVKQPWDVLLDPSLRINATYYITKQILPPLDRMLSLLGVDVLSW